MNTKETEQKYCVAATERDTGYRVSITLPCSYEFALLQKEQMLKERGYKKIYKYFHVAKFPYEKHKND